MHSSNYPQHLSQLQLPRFQMMYAHMQHTNARTSHTVTSKTIFPNAYDLSVHIKSNFYDRLNGISFVHSLQWDGRHQTGLMSERIFEFPMVTFTFDRTTRVCTAYACVSVS